MTRTWENVTGTGERVRITRENVTGTWENGRGTGERGTRTARKIIKLIDNHRFRPLEFSSSVENLHKIFLVQIERAQNIWLIITFASK